MSVALWVCGFRCSRVSTCQRELHSPLTDNQPRGLLADPVAVHLRGISVPSFGLSLAKDATRFVVKARVRKSAVLKRQSRVPRRGLLSILFFFLEGVWCPRQPHGRGSRINEGLPYEFVPESRPDQVVFSSCYASNHQSSSRGSVIGTGRDSLISMLCFLSDTIFVYSGRLATAHM